MSKMSICFSLRNAKRTTYDMCEEYIFHRVNTMGDAIHFIKKMNFKKAVDIMREKNNSGLIGESIDFTVFLDTDYNGNFDYEYEWQPVLFRKELKYNHNEDFILTVESMIVYQEYHIKIKGNYNNKTQILHLPDNYFNNKKRLVKGFGFRKLEPSIQMRLICSYLAKNHSNYWQDLIKLEKKMAVVNGFIFFIDDYRKYLS